MKKRMSSKIFRVTHNGFTLIELLVVISIIALLLSILMPSLNKAREQARRTICAKQFSQIAVIQILYANDFKSWIPRFTYINAVTLPNDTRNVRAWPGVMLAGPFEYCRKSFGMNDKIWVCPSFVGANANSIVWEEGYKGTRLLRSNGTAQWPAAYWTLGSASLVGLVESSQIEPRYGVAKSALKPTDPGDYVLAADKNFRADRDWKSSLSAIAHRQHKTGLPSGANVAHVDGSVSWNFPDKMALNRRTLRESRPEVINVNHMDAVGKYDEWPALGREYFW